MSRPLTLDEFNQLIAIIQDKHCFGGKNWKPENVAIYAYANKRILLHYV